MNKNLYFLSGLPRTGTTLLSSILNQNPTIHVSSTSGLLDFLAGVNSVHYEISKRYKFNDENQIRNIYKSIFNSWYEHIECDHVIDKWRGWINNIQQVKEITGKDPKIIYTFRPMEEIVTSFLYLIDKDPNNFVDREIKSRYKKIDNDIRFKFLWNEGVIGESYHMLQNYFSNSNLNANVLFVSYKELVTNSNNCISKIYNFLDIPTFNHDFENISEFTNDNDSYWEIKELHTIRRKVEHHKKDPKKYLNKSIIDFCEEKNKIFDLIK